MNVTYPSVYKRESPFLIDMLCIANDFTYIDQVLVSLDLIFVRGIPISMLQGIPIQVLYWKS